MATKYPFIKCLHPKQIVNPYTKEPLIVPCGKCEACLLQKSAMNTLKCKLECNSHRFNEFVTLTYDDIYVPKAQVVPLRKNVKEYLPPFLDFDEEIVISSTLHNIGDMYNYALVDVSGRFATDGLVLGAAYMRDIDWFSLRNKIGYGDTINVLRYEDIQLFLKRLRQKIYRYYGQKIRYYCAGEYGPKHYRPHWHIILSYDCPFLAQNIRQIIRSCWTYGRVDSSKSRGKCASYTAGYVNSNQCIPEILRVSQTRPKSYHSIKLGEEFFKVSKEEIYKSKDFRFINQCCNLDGVYSEFGLWRSFTARIFPRCKAYSSKSIEERLEAYRLEISVCRAFGKECKLIYAARHILSYLIGFTRNGHYSYATKFSYDDDIKHLIDYFLRSNGINFKIIKNRPLDKVKLLRSIYTELLCSRYFIRHIAKSHDYSKCKEKVLVIDEFYKYQDYNSLVRQIRWQSDNLTETSTYNDYRYLYSDIAFNADDYADNIYYLSMKEAVMKNFANSIKHKKLNDENNVRCDNY